MRMARSLRLLSPLVALPVLFTGAPAAHADYPHVTVVDDTPDVYPMGQDMYQALKQGEALQCSTGGDTGCKVTSAKLSITKAEKKYLGWSTQTIAKGVPQGPVSIRLNGSMQHDLFILPLPASFRKRVIAKHVVAMKVLITAHSKYSQVESPDGLISTTQNVTHLSSWPSPDSDPKTQWGQGSRFGCRPVAKGDITTGYVKFGGSCPKV
jgi:hypothetical protein